MQDSKGARRAMTFSFDTKEAIEKHVHLDQTEIVVELDLVEGKDFEEAINGLSRYFSISPNLGSALPTLEKIKVLHAEPYGTWVRVENKKHIDIVSDIYNLLN